MAARSHLFHKPRRGLPPATIAIEKLHHPFAVVAPNTWGELKEQPASLDIRLDLRRDFDTTAQGDELDDSTIHYGQLAKKIRGGYNSTTDVLETLSKADDAVNTIALKPSGRFIVSDAMIRVCLPKASTHGVEITLERQTRFDEGGRVLESEIGFELCDLQLMALIGVNDYERSGNQRVVANLSVCVLEKGAKKNESLGLEQIVALFKLERILASCVQESTFETLEALADVAAKQLIQVLLKDCHEGSTIRLRLEKPKAIVFADAAVVEVTRIAEGAAQQVVSDIQAGRSKSKQPVQIFKPYVR